MFPANLGIIYNYIYIIYIYPNLDPNKKVVKKKHGPTFWFTPGLTQCPNGPLSRQKDPGCCRSPGNHPLIHWKGDGTRW